MKNILFFLYLALILPDPAFSSSNLINVCSKHRNFLHIENDNPLIIYSLAEKYLNAGNYKQAIVYFQHTLKLARHNNDRQMVCMTYQNLGKAFRELKNYRAALQYSLQSYVVSIELDSMVIRQKNCSQLSEIYALTGNFPKAYEYQKKSGELNDSISKIAQVKEASTLESEFRKKLSLQISLIKQHEEEVAIAKVKNHQRIIIFLVIIASALSVALTTVVIRIYGMADK